MIIHNTPGPPAMTDVDFKAIHLTRMSTAIMLLYCFRVSEGSSPNMVL
jgi:hypothetical protein